MKKIITTLLISAFVLAGCRSATPPTPTFGTDSTSPTMPATEQAGTEQPTTGKIAGFTASDIAAHHTSSDCWVSIDGKVYDVSPYLNQHPGGAEVIINECGKDASTVFHSMGDKGKDHPAQATDTLQNYYKGLLQ